MWRQKPKVGVNHTTAMIMEWTPEQNGLREILTLLKESQSPITSTQRAVQQVSFSGYLNLTLLFILSYLPLYLVHLIVPPGPYSSVCLTIGQTCLTYYSLLVFFKKFCEVLTLKKKTYYYSMHFNKNCSPLLHIFQANPYFLNVT